MSNYLYIGLFILSVFISSISQAMLKKGAESDEEFGLKQYLHPLILTAYALFFGCTLITVLCYKIIPLSLGLVLESTGYIFVTIISTVALKEKMSLKKIVGNILIVVGIIIFSLGK